MVGINEYHHVEPAVFRPLHSDIASRRDYGLLGDEVSGQHGHHGLGDEAVDEARECIIQHGGESGRRGSDAPAREIRRPVVARSRWSSRD